MSRLGNVVDNEVVNKTVYVKLKANAIDTDGPDLKIKYDTDKSDLEEKVSDADEISPDTSGLVKKKNRL